MNKIRSFSVLPRKIYLFSSLFLLMSIYACKKDGELTPSFDTSNVVVEFCDTLTIKSTLIEEDSFRTEYDIAMLGIYNDPIFGVKSSSIYTNIGLSGPTNFGTNFSIDSVVLTLDYTEVYGNPNSSMSINVYELSSVLEESKEYYSNDTASFSSTLLKSISFVPNLTDSVFTLADSVMHKPHLRIKLDEPSFIAKLNVDSMYDNNTELNAVFKGLYITTNNTVDNNNLLPEEGVIASFDMNSSLSAVTVYYNDSLQENFSIDADIKKFSHLSYNNAGTDIEKHLNNSILKDSTISYLSTIGGIKTKLEIPHLNSILKDGNIIINKAELIVPVAINTKGNFDDPIPQISLFEVNSDEENLLINLGVLNTSTNIYTIDVSRYINRLLYVPPLDYEIYLMSPFFNASRVVLGSPYNTFAPLKLSITYSKKL